MGTCASILEKFLSHRILKKDEYRGNKKLALNIVNITPQQIVYQSFDQQKNNKNRRFPILWANNGVLSITSIL